MRPDVAPGSQLRRPLAHPRAASRWDAPAVLGGHVADAIHFRPALAVLHRPDQHRVLRDEQLVVFAVRVPRQVERLLAPEELCLPAALEEVKVDLGIPARIVVRLELADGVGVQAERAEVELLDRTGGRARQQPQRCRVGDRAEFAHRQLQPTRVRCSAHAEPGDGGVQRAGELERAGAAPADRNGRLRRSRLAFQSAAGRSSLLHARLLSSCPAVLLMHLRRCDLG